MQPSVARVHEIVSAVEPWDDEEAGHKADILGWVESGDEVFRRARPATPPRHLVSYVVLVDAARRSMLLVERRDAGVQLPAGRSMLLVEHRDAGLHLPAGGHVEPGEDPSETALREAREELGADASFLQEIGRRPLMVSQATTVGVSAGHTDVDLWYVLDGDAEMAVTGDAREFAAWRWWRFDEVLAADPAVLDPHLQRFTAKLTHRLAAEKP